MAAPDINTPAKRAKLPPRREPYWHQLDRGRFIGYRKTSTGGAWIARLGKKQGSLGTGLLEWPEAVAAVHEWCDDQTRGGNGKYTFRDSVEAYCNNIRIEKDETKAHQARIRLLGCLPDKLLDAQLKELTHDALEEWRNGMVKGETAEDRRKSKVTANRVLAMVKAALNQSYRRDLVRSDKPWRTLSGFPKVNAARLLFLTDKEVRRLLAATDGAFHDLVKAAVLTGARYGELAAAKVSDLDAERGTLRLDGKTGSRDAFLSAAGLAFFINMAQDKLPAAPLLLSPRGAHWQRNEQWQPMRNAARAARLPQDAVFYSLRHFHISKAVKAGVSLLAVARNTGTSVAMIEKHYGKFTPDDMRRLMDLVEVGLG